MKPDCYNILQNVIRFEIRTDKLFAYTDRSKTTFRIGAAKKTKLFLLNFWMTPQYTQLNFIEPYLLNNVQKDNSILCTDSSSSLVSIQNVRSTNPIITNNFSKIYSLHAFSKHIMMLRLPAHQNITQSTDVDEEAKTNITKKTLSSDYKDTLELKKILLLIVTQRQQRLKPVSLLTNYLQ